MFTTMSMVCPQPMIEVSIPPSASVVTVPAINTDNPAIQDSIALKEVNLYHNSISERVARRRAKCAESMGELSRAAGTENTLIAGADVP